MKIFIPILFLFAFSFSAWAQECNSDFNCGIGYKCVKPPMSGYGTCMKSVDSYGNQQYNMPNPNSVGPNMNTQGQCRFNTDCPSGFRCDFQYKVCIRN